jgi:hypothetical protein
MITILRYGRIYIGRIGQVTTLNRRSLLGGPERPPYRNRIPLMSLDLALNLGKLWKSAIFKIIWMKS